MKRSETIALYRDAYLEGKDEAARQKFFSKSEDKQYATLMTWKRRKGIPSKSKDAKAEAPLTASSITDTILNMSQAVEALDQLGEDEKNILLEATEALRHSIADYEVIKLDRRLAELNSQRESINNEIQNLEDRLRQQRGW